MNFNLGRQVNNFSTQIVTSNGFVASESKLSSPVTATTTFLKTKLERFRDSLGLHTIQENAVTLKTELEKLRALGLKTSQENAKTAAATRQDLDQLMLQFKTHLSYDKGLIITGGNGAKKGVEILDLKHNRGCHLPDLPDDRYYHTQV